MKVVSNPHTFATSDVLTPEDLNEVYLYARDAVADVASKRWVKFPLVYQCVTDVGTPYTQASGALLVLKFWCPWRCVVERAQIFANMTQSGGAVEVAITKNSDTSTPTGASAPWLTTGATAIADASVETTAFSGDRFVLAANTEYDITISGSTFSLERFDLALSLATDRWNSAGTESTPDFDPTLFTDASARDATVVSANNSALATAALAPSSALGAPAGSVFMIHGVSSTSDTDLLRVTFPVVETARATMEAKAVYLDCVMAGTGGNTVDAIWYDEGAAGFADATAVTAGVSRASGSATATETMNGAAAETGANDFYIDVLPGNTEVVTRAIVIAWVART